MGTRDFLYTGAPLDSYTIPAGVSSIELWAVGGGIPFDYWPDYPNSALPSSPYVLDVPARGLYLDGLAVTPGDVITVQVGGAAIGPAGGFPDGGDGQAATYVPGFDLTAPGSGGGGATRIWRNGVLWIVAAGRGGSACYSRWLDLWPISEGAGPTTIPPNLEPGDPDSRYAVVIAAPGFASGTEKGAPAAWSLGLSPEALSIADGVREPTLCLVGSGAGGGGYWGGSSGGLLFYYDGPEEEAEGDVWLLADPGLPGGGLVPSGASWQYWEPAATVLYGNPGDPGYSEEYGGIPEPYYVPGGDYLPGGLEGQNGYVRIGGLPDDQGGWSVGRIAS